MHAVDTHAQKVQATIKQLKASYDGGPRRRNGRRNVSARVLLMADFIFASAAHISQSSLPPTGRSVCSMASGASDAAVRDYPVGSSGTTDTPPVRPSACTGAAR